MSKAKIKEICAREGVSIGALEASLTSCFVSAYEAEWKTVSISDVIKDARAKRKKKTIEDVRRYIENHPRCISRDIPIKNASMHVSALISSGDVEICDTFRIGRGIYNVLRIKQ